MCVCSTNLLLIRVLGAVSEIVYLYFATAAVVQVDCSRAVALLFMRVLWSVCHQRCGDTGQDALFAI